MLVRRILLSPQFARSERQREFLEYICDRTLCAEPKEVHEQQIGCDVFGRPEKYNPAEDNIVRVAARQLRVRLKEYFEAEGKAEELILEIPKGGYTPVFLRRQAPPPPPVAVPAAPVRSHLPRAALAAALLLVLMAVWLWLENRSLRQRVSALTPAPNFVNSLFFASRHTLHVVVSDAQLNAIAQLSGEAMSLESYANRKYPKLRHLAEWPGREAFSTRLSNRQHTSIGDAALATRIAKAAECADCVRLRHARNLHAQDFRADDFILLGMVRPNPWISLFEQQLNFYSELAEASAPSLIHNRNPKPGEQTLYAPANNDDNAGLSYARVALVPNLARTGKVLLIGGTSMVAMEEAGHFLLNPASLDSLRKLLGEPAGLGYFELLFEVTALEGTGKGARLIAHRTSLTRQP